MKVELRLYPTLENAETVSFGDFDCLEDAWHEAYRLTTITRYNLRDFFTMEKENEISNRV